MKALVFVPILCLFGCSVPRSQVPHPSTISVSRAIHSASASVDRSKDAMESVAKDLAKLSKTATPKQTATIASTSRALNVAKSELVLVKNSLSESHSATVQLQGRIDGLADDLGRAQDAERKSRIAVGFWRSWTFRLAMFSTLLVIWVLRKPILRLAGVASFCICFALPFYDRTIS